MDYTELYLLGLAHVMHPKLKMSGDLVDLALQRAISKECDEQHRAIYGW